MTKPDLIVSRHPATVAWLRDLFGQEIPVVESASADDVRGRVVAGNLPLHLAAVAKEIQAVEFSGEPPRGREYTAEDMTRAGARLRAYVVAPSGCLDAVYECGGYGGTVRDRVDSLRGLSSG